MRADETGATRDKYTIAHRTSEAQERCTGFGAKNSGLGAHRRNEAVMDQSVEGPHHCGIQLLFPRIQSRLRCGQARDRHTEWGATHII
jgi:hypothetical protein